MDSRSVGKKRLLVLVIVFISLSHSHYSFWENSHNLFHFTVCVTDYKSKCLPDNLQCVCVCLSSEKPSCCFLTDKRRTFYGTVNWMNWLLMMRGTQAVCLCVKLYTSFPCHDRTAHLIISEGESCIWSCVSICVSVRAVEYILCPFLNCMLFYKVL